MASKPIGMEGGVDDTRASAIVSLPYHSRLEERGDTMMHGEHLTAAPACGEESCITTGLPANMVGIVWVLIAFDLVLTLLTGYVLWEKVQGLTPFSRDSGCQLFPGTG